jgi:endoglucanase
MSWAYWEFGAGFGVYNPATRQWREELLGALIPD